MALGQLLVFVLPLPEGHLGQAGERRGTNKERADLRKGRRARLSWAG